MKYLTLFFVLFFLSCSSQDMNEEMLFSVTNIDEEDFFYPKKKVVNDFTKGNDDNSVIYEKKKLDNGKIKISADIYIYRFCHQMYEGDFETKGDTINLFLNIAKVKEDDDEETMCVSKLSYTITNLEEMEYKVFLKMVSLNPESKE